MVCKAQNYLLSVPLRNNLSTPFISQNHPVVLAGGLLMDKGRKNTEIILDMSSSVIIAIHTKHP
jgi:hypothetical protein